MNIAMHHAIPPTVSVRTWGDFKKALDVVLGDDCPVSAIHFERTGIGSLAAYRPLVYLGDAGVTVCLNLDEGS